jgi:adenosyl cobinamide kinase/adenosyl cobinamide phosphate guanylyltransferase
MLGGHDIDASIARLRQALAARRAPTVLISNEVGLGIVPETPLGRAFRDKAGMLNQEMAARADRVIFMCAGLPLTMKPQP